jgi:pimeloyl-ACP methyl ester carboxylesterase
MTVTEIREPGFVGAFGFPDGVARPHAVLALGGSDGGVPGYFLRLLVPEGFGCLALPYFNTPDTQPALTEVPLERVEQALRWLLDNPRVDLAGGRVSLIGASKGGELALLAAALFPDLVGPVVAYTPSSVVWEGIDFRLPRPPGLSSWSVNGRPLPFVPIPAIPPASSERGLSFLPAYDGGLNNESAVAEAVIPVEEATGPILLISGGDDRMWPAERMCRMVVDRLRRAGRDNLVRHLNFPKAGHALFPIGASDRMDVSASIPVDLGGGVEAANNAHASTWPEVLRHLTLGAAASTA